MSDYSQITDFSVKDALSAGDPEKVILGADVDAELDAISTAIASKVNTSGLLTAIVAVDGAGSGIDADSVDGVGPFATADWAPTITNISNITTTASSQWYYIQVGAMVLFAGTITVTPTSTGTTEFEVALPVASNFGVLPVGSVSFGNNSLASNGFVSGDAANDRIQVRYVTDSASAVQVGVSGMYKVI